MRSRRALTWPDLMVYLVLALCAVIVAAPFAYAISTSLKANSEVFEIPMRWIPPTLHWDNYTRPFQTTQLARQFLNSVVVGFAVTFLNVITCTLAGYSFARFRYWGRDALFLAVLATLMVPIQVILVPLFALVQGLGWLNSYPGLIIPSATSAFGVFLMRQYFLTVPRELLEAARIDGASELRIFVQIAVPLVTPAISALIIFIFMNNWNSFLWPLLVTNKEEMMTLPLGIANFQSVYSTNFPQLMAVSLAATAPVLAVFAVLQRQFIQGMALTGLKG